MDNQHKNRGSKISGLKRSAAKGNLLSMFELYECYKTGKYVEKADEAQAKIYWDQLAEKLPTAPFKIKSLSLYNFRRFKEFDLKLNERLTVIIGNNGMGKTSIVEAIAKSLSWFNNNLERDSSGRPVTEHDVNVNADDYCDVVTQFSAGKNTPVNMALVKAAPGSTNVKSSELTCVKTMASVYRHLAGSQNVVFPLLAYYSVDRSNFEFSYSLTEGLAGDSFDNRYQALDDALQGPGKLAHFSQYYVELANKAEGNLAEHYERLKKAVTSRFKEQFNVELSKKDSVSTLDSLIDELMGKEGFSEAAKGSSNEKFQKQLSLVNEAIERLVPDVTSLKIDRSTGKARLMVDNFGNRVNIAQLSEGQKTLVALTGDIARRLVSLNPDVQNPLEGHGIIIIDEIELHLHPKWQQEVLGRLQDTFPNIQFIVTTHSPQVINHVDLKHASIFKLENSPNDIAKVQVRETYGRNTDLIYEGSMGVSSRPKEVQEKLDEIFRLIADQDIKDARNKIADLRLQIGEDGELLKAETLIKRLELIGR